jgi:NADPH:quinone reductase-like Zn-dependent oxidoreductase/acyl transferase domain-containing protein/NAD(P)-dependent dehydrogenase (short-subunit alcohol dehydrogenase family)/acyl carrier protein
LLREWNVVPNALIGHSSGEIAAAFAARALDFDTALAIAFYRGKIASSSDLPERLGKGAMMAIGASPEEVEPLLAGLSSGIAMIACYNSADSVTVAGDECAIDQLVALTKDLGLFSRKLLIDQAYHSDHMLPLAAPYFDLIKNVLPKCRATAEDGSAQTGVLYSSVTGAALPLDKLKSGWYWASNLTSPVLFATAFEAMLKDFKKSHDGNIHIVEIGSHKALAGPIKALCDTNTSIRASYSSTLVRKSDDKRCLLETAAECSRAGVSVDMDAVFQTMRDQRRESQPQCLVGLPKYSFNHTRRYWHASRLAHGPDMKNGRPWNALLGRRVDTTPTPSIQCRNIFKLSWIPWLRDHVVNGTIVFPLAGFLCIAVEALEVFREERSIVVHGFQLSKVSVSKAFALTDDEQYELWTTLTTNSTDSTELDGAAALNFEISSWTAARGYIQHCSGTASLVLQDESGLVVDPLEEHSEAVSNPMRTKLANLRQSAQRGMDRDSYYRQLARGGLAYGHYFKGIQEIKVGNNVGFGRVHGFDTASSMPGGFEGTLRVHPATLDAALQVSGIHVGSGSFEGQTYMPVYMERMFVLSSAQHIADISLDVFTFDSITPEKSKTTSVNLLMCLSGSDTPIIEVDQLTCLDVDQAEDRLGQADMINPHKTMWLDHPDFLSLQEIAEISTVNDPQDMAKLEAASTAAEQALLSLLDFVRSLTYLNPSMSILEIGAGISGLASRIQEVVTSSSGPRYQHYDYTDISSETFPKTEDQFPNITCRRLDLTRDVGSQGFEMGSFDLVLGSLASYPACDAPECLRNLSLLLKPNGHLALFGLGTSYPLAQLPDICTQLSQSFGPSEIQWSTMLRTAEFHAISTLRQGANSCAVWARKGSQKLMQNGETAPTPVGLVASPLAWDKAHAIKSMLESSNGKTCWTPTMLTPNAAKTFTGTLICFEDVSVLNLASADHENFNTIQQLLCTAKNIIWVTSPDYTAEESCRQAFALGFGRVLRAEDATRRFVVLQADAQDTSPEALSRCLEAMMLYEGAGSTGASDLENEYRQRGNRLQFARLLPDELLYDGIARLADVTKSSTVALSDSSVTISATCDRPGTMNSLHYAASPEPIALEGLGDYEVVLQVEAVGVNFKDLLITLGRVPWEEPGKECSGVVLAAGKHASFAAGDRVVHWGDGLLANRIICHDYSLAAIPSFMTMQEAASIPLVFSTAYECLVNVARLEDGERVLIHAASGGVGQAAIMLSQWLKAEVYCTVSTPEKKALIMSRYGIPASRIFSSRSPAFAKKLMEETGGKGVDVVLNSVAGDMLKATWSCMGVQGRFVEIGKRDALTNNTLDMLPFAKGCSYNAVDLGLTIGNKPKAARRLLSKVMSLFEERQHFRPVEPITVYPAGEIHDALRKMQAGKHTGKLVVNMNKGQTVDVRNSRSAFHGDASYIITGGTGGLGCSLVRWMISRGARNIHLFSRSGAKALDTANWDETLAFARQENAVVTAHVCDIVNINDVERTLGAMTAAGAPTVKGVIHAAMVLRDALYERTNATDWETVIAPKIHGAINLHRALNDHPQLDFFVCLSSIAILGIVPGQAAYAGGNCVLDAFCSWRQSQGLAASSISLPAISDAGYVAEQAPLPGHEKLEASQLSSREVKMLVEAALDRSLFNPASNNSHTVAGLVKHPGTTQVLQDKGPLFSVLLRDNANAFGDDVVRPSDGSTVSIKASLSETTSPEEAEKVVAAALVGKLASMMSVSPDDVTMETSIGNLGIDSLVAVELRNWLAKELEATIPVLTIVSTASVSVLVELVMSKSSLVVGKFGLANGDVPK